MDLEFKQYRPQDRELLAGIFCDPEIMKYAHEDCYSQEKLDRFITEIPENYNARENRQGFQSCLQFLRNRVFP